MTVPKLRFKDDNGNDYPVWKVEKIGDVFNYIVDKKHPEETVLTIIQGIGTVPRTQSGIDISYNKNNIENYKKVKKNDFIVHLRSFQGGLEIANSDGIISPAYTVLRNKFTFYPKFFQEYFHTNEFINHNLNFVVEGVRDGRTINVKDLKKRPIPIPSLPEQKKIADFFYSFDKRIETTQKKLATLEKLKKGFMQKIFSQQLRFKDDNGNDYPAWEEKKLGDVMDDFSYGMNVSSKRFDGQNKYIRITDIDESTHKYDSSDIVSPDGKLEQKYLVKDGDILFARTGASVGKSYLYNSEDGNLYFAGFLIRGRVKSSYNPYFIYLQTLTFNYKKWVYVFSMRTGQPGINAEEYRSFKFLCPSLPEQKKIADFLSAFDEKMNLVRKEVDTLQTIKKGLLQQMFV